MNGFAFSFFGQKLTALGSGALWWPEQELLCVSDLHLGKSERTARRGGTILPPYETQDTLGRLAADINGCGAHTIVCLGDSFDDIDAAAALPEADRMQIASLQAGRRWIWIEGNHDPGPVDMGGTHLAEWACGPLMFRHIADPAKQAEISGHYHPKIALRTRGRGVTRPAFLLDAVRLILPAYGTYTGGLRSDADALASLVARDAIAIVTGAHPRPVPIPR